MAIAVLISVAILGAIALRIGLRGRVIDDHPLCATCGFDLTGRSPDGYRCTECGAGLHWPESIVIGHRVRRQGWVGVGLGVLAISVAGTAALVADSSNAFNINQHLPLSLLLLMAEFAPRSGDGALSEIVSRARGGTLSASQINAVVGSALVVQGNASKAWDDRWGDLIEYERAAGAVPDAQWIQYARQAGAAGFNFSVRPKVRMGDPIPYWIESKPMRTATTSKLILAVGIHLTTQPDQLLPYNLTCPFVKLFGGGRTGSSLSPGQFPSGFAPGQRTVYARSNVTTGFYPFQKNVLPAGSEFPDLKQTIEVLPASQPSVRAVPNPSVEEKIRSGISVEWQIASTSPMNYNCNVIVNQTPVALSFDVYIRTDGKERKIGSFATPPRTHQAAWMLQTDHSLPVNFGYVVAPPGSGSHGTLILRSAPGPAINSVDVFDYWDGTIELKDIPIRNQ